MTEPFNLTALVTMLALVFFLFTVLRVGAGRAKYNVAAPATVGHPEFERLFRVQMNTLEGLMLFLPSLWLFSFYWGERIAAALGAVWLVGRLFYAIGYAAAPDKRSAGFGIQALAMLALVIGAIAGIIRSFMALGFV